MLKHMTTFLWAFFLPIHITAEPPYILDLARAGDSHVAYGLCVPLLAPSPPAMYPLSANFPTNDVQLQHPFYLTTKTVFPPCYLQTARLHPYHSYISALICFGCILNKNNYILKTCT